MNKTFAKAYDFLMTPIERRYVGRWRRQLLKHAKGHVLEIGAGTGINFALYKKPCEKVIAIEPNPYMIEKAKLKAKKAVVPINIIEAKAEHLPLPDEHFDTIVVTLVLCSVDDPVRVIEEMKRVLKPNGIVLLLEHVKMDQPYASLQNLVTPVWKHLCDGCHLNRDTERLIRDGGFRIITKKTYLSGFALSLIGDKGMDANND